MKYFWSALSLTPTLALTKQSCGRLLLSVSLCLLVLGCNSQSASTTNPEDKTTPDSEVAHITATAENTTTAPKDDEGTSLIDAAKNNQGSRKRSSPMIAEKRPNSALQATLIGDYMGMLPCSTCDGITLTLNLRADGTVEKTSVYSNSKTSQPPLIESGIYRQDNNIITVVYDEENIETYAIQDNHLVRLDVNKRPDADYTLSRK